MRQLTLLVQCGMISFSLNIFSDQIQCSHVFLIVQFPESSNLKQSYFIADETRDFLCIPVLPENFQSAPPVFFIRPDVSQVVLLRDYPQHNQNKPKKGKTCKGPVKQIFLCNLA